MQEIKLALTGILKALESLNQKMSYLNDCIGEYHGSSVLEVVRRNT